MKTVRIVISFPVPVRESKNVDSDLCTYWEKCGDKIEIIKQDFIDLVENEHTGMAEFETVKMEEFIIS